jgi:hypothetical protein
MFRTMIWTSNLLILCVTYHHFKLNPLNCWYDSLIYRHQYLINVSHSPFCRKMCILLLVQGHCPPIWPPALPLNVTYIWIVPPKAVIRDPKMYIVHSMFQISYTRVIK